MQKIIIKNFGPIKEVELDIQDFMVFIGPQATGKSTIAKLVWFFRNHLLFDTESLEDSFANLFSKTYLHTNSYLSFQYEEGTEITIQGTKLDIYWKDKDLRNKNEHQISDYMPASRAGIAGIYNSIKSFLVGNLSGLAMSGKLSDYLERLTILYFQRLELDKSMLIRGFSPSATTFSMNNFVNSLFDAKSARIFNQLTHKILSGGEIYVDKEGKEFIKANDRLIPLHYASTGQQETYGLLIRLLSILTLQNANLVKQTNNLIHNLLYVEEPESHLFPLGQKAIVELLSLFFNNKEENALLLTTHSPYILSAVNNLLFAQQCVKKYPILHTEFDKIISQSCWLPREKVGVYFVNEGKIRSIIDENTGLIGVNELDDVSEIMMEDFDAMMELYRKENRKKVTNEK